MSAERQRGWWLWAVGLAAVGLALGGWGLLPCPSAVADEGEGEPEVQVEDISILPRVPVYGTDPLGTNEKSVTVTLWPSPLPAGKKVTVEISKLSGTGGATFDDGSTSKDITQTTTLKVRGTINSSESDNMLISATYEGKGMSRTFTVSTWPYDLINGAPSGGQLFGFDVFVFWDSESGDEADLTNVKIREHVTYGDRPDPPFHLAPENNPEIREIPSTTGWALDFHEYPQAGVNFTGDPAHATYTASQKYQFMDTVKNTSWFNGNLGNATIERKVDASGETYIFTTKKTGPGNFTHTILETPETP